MLRVCLSLTFAMVFIEALKIPSRNLCPAKLHSAGQDIPPVATMTKPHISASELVATATSVSEVLHAASLLHLPEDQCFKPHLRQLVHQRKRIKTATHALKRLSKWLVGISCDVERTEVVSSKKFHKLARCATLPLQAESDKNDGIPPRPSKEDIEFYCDAIRALGILNPPLSIVNIVENSLIVMGEHVAENASDASVSGALIALERLNLMGSKVMEPIVERERKLNLPFKLLPSLVADKITMEEIDSEVTFRQDTFTTLKGDKVLERRLTCWMADKGVGGLAYSGKIMPPVAFTRSVARVRDYIHDQTGIYYDCALLNFYRDGNCACKYHSDPDHGKIWSRDTVVVSIGETRRFNLRKINKNAKCNEDDPHSFHVKHGDVLYMFGDCQDLFQHSVMSSEGKWNNSPRASIVFKKALLLPGGRRGHGLSSEGAKFSSSSARGWSHEETQTGYQKHLNCNNQTQQNKMRGRRSQKINRKR